MARWVGAIIRGRRFIEGQQLFEEIGILIAVKAHG